MWVVVFKQNTSYEMRMSYCSSDVCASDLRVRARRWRHLDRAAKYRGHVHHLYDRHLDQSCDSGLRADEADDSARDPQAQGHGSAAGDAHRLYRADGAPVRSALRHAADRKSVV